MVRCGKCRFCYQLKNESWCDYIKEYVRDDSSCEHGEFPEDYSEPQTNYDRIISKTPEEMAEFITPVKCIDCRVPDCGVGEIGNNKTCSERILDWLKQEATE